MKAPRRIAFAAVVALLVGVPKGALAGGDLKDFLVMMWIF